ncbi:amidohydrolase [Pseudonocardia acaciae]|uniref:amidohydrolase n=1 Tax=Pseudonocardia acaciae TaxID=551276 RepID=UPI000491CEAA|nr:amidohydrolase [Pseudonocardia acaciae]
MNPELILVAGAVHTMNGENGRPPVRAVAVEDGRIAAVGGARDVREWRTARTEVLDLGDAVLTPGLTDGHIHPIHGMAMAGGADLSSVKTVDELRTHLGAAAEGQAPDGWVLAWGLDPNVFGDRPPRAGVFEDVLGGRPAFVRLFDGHSGLASSRALARAGITGPRRFAQRAEIACDAEGRPTGLLLEFAAMEPVLSVLPTEPVAARAQRLLRLLAEMAAVGLTGGHVMDFEDDAAAVLAAAEDAGDLPVRLRFAPWCVPGVCRDGLAELVAAQGTGGRRWRVGGVKFMIDGTIDNGTAWLDQPDAHGESTAPLWPDPGDYAHAVHRLAATGVQTATHAIGDAAVRTVLDVLARAPHAPGRAPHRVEHIETLPSTLVGEFRRLGVVASMQPTHCTHYTRADHSDNWSRRLGRRRAQRAFRCRDLRTAGVTLALGSDWPVAPFDPRGVLADAQLRRPAGRPDVTPVLPSQGLTARMALEGYTSHAARAAGEHGLAGVIRPGARADLTAFTVDPLRADPDDLAHAPIALTLVDGRITHRAA